jgi:hypothetical protein
MRYLRAIMLAVLAAGITGAALTGAPVADEPKTQLKKAALQKLKAAAAARKAADAGKPGDKLVTLPTEAKVAKPLPTVLAPAAMVRQIDALIDAKLAAEKVTASPQAGDAEFLRRASLDLTGVIPTADAARAFLDDRDPAKRAELIDRLLAADGYGGHLADLWTAKLYLKDSDNRFVAKEPLHKWLVEEFNENAPWDALVTKLVTATGTAEDNPAVTFFMANRSVDKLTDAVGTHFLGQSVSCAQCHNHPFTAMKQTEYWGLAAFFSKVNTPRPRNAMMGGDNAKLAVTEGTGPSRGKDFFPESTLKVAPHVLDGTPVKVTASEPYRPALAKWLTAPDNADFARAAVNRTWAQLFGRGLVNPVEDMHEGNPASHPELLDLLAGQFAAAKFDLKHLTRTLMLTNAYQRSSKPTAGNAADATLVGHATMKVMIPEQLYDSLQLLQARAATPTGPREKGARGLLKGRPNATGRDGFVAFFLVGADKPNATEYEAGIPQALRLMNSRQTLGNNPGAARSFAKPGAKPTDTLEEMYLATLTRRPTPDETTKMLAYLKDGGPTGLADVLWVLTNTSEFVLIR